MFGAYTVPVSVAFVGFSATAPVAQAAPTTSAVSKASKWLVAHPATADDGYGGLITSTLGLAVLDTKGGAATVRKQVAALSAGASANVTGNAGRAANLAILARIMHLSARNFGGVNLVTTLQSTIAADGQVGSFGSAYAQALAIIFINAYANAENEKRALEAARAVWPNEHVSASHQVLPEIREFERASTTALNAYLQPGVGDYLGRLESALAQNGFTGTYTPAPQPVAPR